MIEEQLFGIPETIKQAVETLTEFYAESLPEMLQISQSEFVVSAHYGAGLFIHNSWYSNWYEGHNFESWPKEKPAIVAHFHNQGIVNPDYMSSTLMNCFYWKVHNQ